MTIRRIVVHGAGALGGVLGARLAEALPVALVGRPPHTGAIALSGLRLEGQRNQVVRVGGNFQVRESLAALQPGLGHGDLVLLCVKAAQAAGAARELILAGLPPLATVVAMQNGTGFEDDLRTGLKGRCEFFFAVSHVGANLLSPGRIEDWGGEIVLPETPVARELSGHFIKGGLSAVCVADVEIERWKKVAFNCALNAVGALLECRNRETLLPELKSLRLAVLAEARDEAVTRGVALPDAPALLEEFEQRAGASANENSMLQDLRRAKPTENPYLNGAIARMARERGKQAPANALLGHWIEKLERVPDDAQRAPLRARALELCRKVDARA